MIEAIKENWWGNITTPPTGEVKWLAGGHFNSSGQNYLKSTDGINWTYHRIPTMFDIYNLTNINGVWFASGAKIEGVNGEYDQKIMKSTDTITWTDVTIASDISTESISLYGSLWIVTGRSSTNTMYTSTDGVNWTPRGLAAQDITTMGVAFDDEGKYIAYGENDAAATTVVAYSTNGTSWTDSTGMSNAFSSNTGIYFGFDALYSSKWVVTGSSSGEQTIATSTDGGVTWTPVSNVPVNHTGRRLVRFNNLWVVGGRGNFEIATSIDALTWTGRLNENLIDIRDFAQDINKLISVGVESTQVGQIYSSTNGTTWNQVTSTNLGLYAIAAKI